MVEVCWCERVVDVRKGGGVVGETLRVLSHVHERGGEGEGGGEEGEGSEGEAGEGEVED